jgi:DNA-directed RNA polymerase specialized sigma24 family protein
MNKTPHTFSPSEMESDIVNALTDNPCDDSRILNKHLDVLYKKCQAMVNKTALIFNLDKELADDLFQETLIVLIENIQEEKFSYTSRAAFYGYLKTILERKASKMADSGKLFCRINDGFRQGPDDSFRKWGEERNYFERGTLQRKVLELFREKLSYTGARVLEIALIWRKSNSEGAQILNYANEGVFRKKKSHFLREFERKIKPGEKELLRGLSA